MLGTVPKRHILASVLIKNLMRTFNILQTDFQRDGLGKIQFLIKVEYPFSGSLLTHSHIHFPFSFVNIVLIATHQFLSRSKHTAALSRDAALHSSVNIMSCPIK